jgi:hypothetical protein
VPNLISEIFIVAMKHCIGRRVEIDHLFSDNVSNFVGASREMKALFKSAEFLRQTIDCSKTQFQCHFIPLISPRFRGMWETSVKFLKYHWNRIVGKVLLNIDELSVLITEMEGL